MNCLSAESVLEGVSGKRDGSFLSYGFIHGHDTLRSGHNGLGVSTVFIRKTYIDYSIFVVNGAALVEIAVGAVAAGVCRRPKRPSTKAGPSSRRALGRREFAAGGS